MRKGLRDSYLERWLVTASSSLGDMPIESLSPVICLVMVSSFVATITIVCILKDSELEDRSEESMNASRPMAPEDDVAG